MPEEEKNQPPKYILLRFFDSSVEPGTRIVTEFAWC